MKLLKDYIIKGFVPDDERLKNGQYFGKDYFRELLKRVRSIRASERRIYQQISNGKTIIQNPPSHLVPSPPLPPSPGRTRCLLSINRQ